MTGSRSRGHRQVTVIGTFTATIDHRRLVVRPSAQRVVALLAVRGDVSRSDAAGLLWPDLTQRRAQANLRTALWRARSDCPQFVCDEGDVIRLAAVHSDLSALRDWAWSTLRGDEEPPQVPRLLTEDLLPGWGDEWLVQPREELRLLLLYALESCSRRLLEVGRLGEAAGLALTAVNIDPLRESANRILIEVHLGDGNRSDALRQFRRYAHLLRGEMQAEPGPDLTELVAALSARPALTGSAARSRAR